MGNANVRETNNPGKIPLETPTKWKKVSVEKLSPKELLAVKFLFVLVQFSVCNTNIQVANG